MSSSSAPKHQGGVPTKAQLASATKPLALTPLLTDLWLLDRLMYKSTYTTGRMPHMHKLAAVRRALRRLTTHVRVNAALETLLVHKNTVEAADVAAFLAEWIKLAKLLPVIARLARAASLALIAEMGAGRYVAFCVVAVAIMARVGRVAGFIAQEMQAPYVRFRGMLTADVAKTLPTTLGRGGSRRLGAAAHASDDMVAQSQVVDRSTFAAASSPAPSHDVDGNANPWAQTGTPADLDVAMLDSLDVTHPTAPISSQSRTKQNKARKRPMTLTESDDDASQPDPVLAVTLDDLPSFFAPLPMTTSAAKGESVPPPPKKKARVSSDTLPSATGTAGELPKKKAFEVTGSDRQDKKKSKPKKSVKGKAKSAGSKDEIDDLFGSLF